MFLQLNKFVEMASVILSKVIPQRRTSEDPVQVVGLLGPSDLEYMITLLAVSRLGHTVLLLSTRIAEDAYVSLVESTSASFLIVHLNFVTMGQKVAKRTGIVVQEGLTREQYDNTAANPYELPSASLEATKEAGNICWVSNKSFHEV
jgi:acyl-CoA synthetase (AMP-forming)/AMP-acid ligase II